MGKYLEQQYEERDYALELAKKHNLLPEDNSNMTWEELKEEAKKRGGKVVEIDYKDYIDGYAYTSHLVEAIKFRDIYYIIDGDILMKFENIKKFCKIKHVPYCEGYEKMLAIMKALQ